jgi:hypothetical protein
MGVNTIQFRISVVSYMLRLVLFPILYSMYIKL